MWIKQRNVVGYPNNLAGQILHSPNQRTIVVNSPLSLRKTNLGDVDKSNLSAI